MIQICLIRHGETEWNRLGMTQGASDIPLNDEGRRQARTTGNSLAAIRWDAIYASPLDRAMETAAIICDQLGENPDQIIPDPDLVERNYGAAEGLSMEQRKSAFGDSSAIPDAEPWDSVRKRGAAAMDRILRNHPEQRVLVVAHGGLIRSILTALIDDGGFYRPGGLKNAGATLVSTDNKGRWQTLWYNLDGEELAEQLTDKKMGKEKREPLSLHRDS